jgi:hypothetical protein
VRADRTASAETGIVRNGRDPYARLFRFHLGDLRGRSGGAVHTAQERTEELNPPRWRAGRLRIVTVQHWQQAANRDRKRYRRRPSCHPHARPGARGAAGATHDLLQVRVLCTIHSPVRLHWEAWTLFAFARSTAIHPSAIIATRYHMQLRRGLGLRSITPPLFLF